MQRHDFLTGLHSRLQPRGYLEIGGRHRPDLAVMPVGALCGMAQPGPAPAPAGRRTGIDTTPPPRPRGPVTATGLANPKVQPRGGPDVRGARVAILLVNGFDRFSQDPFDLDEALTYPWVDVCLRQVRVHSAGTDYEVLVWDNSYLPEHQAILDRHGVSVFEHPNQKDVRHGAALDGLLRQVRNSTEYVVTLDTDAFPIRDDWLPELLGRLESGAELAGVWRDELAPDVVPYVHPSCLAARRRTLRELRVSFQRKQAQDVAQNISLAVSQRGGKLAGLRRSNARNPHYMMAGIYGDLVYHHGAGSRKASFWTSEDTRADEAARVTLRDAVFAGTEPYLAYLRGRIDDAGATAAGLGDVVELVRNAGRRPPGRVRRLVARLSR